MPDSVSFVDVFPTRRKVMSEQIPSRRGVLIGAAASFTTISSLSLAASSETRLSDPFGRPPIAGAAASVCIATPPPLSDLGGQKFYTDASNSRMNQALVSADAVASRPLTAFTAAVQASSDQWLATGSNDAAACGLGHLSKWAAAGALQGKFTEQAKANRRFNLAGLSVAYLALRHSPAASGSASVIGQWFESVALVCARDESRLENNLLYWLAAGVCGSAIANQNVALFNRGVAMARRGIAEIADDGSLPREVARGARALTYHSFSLGPLLLVAELARVNGIDLYSENDSALRRLVSFTIANIVDPSKLTAAAGAPQIWTGVTDNTVPWVEIARARFGGKWLTGTAAHLTPVKYPFLGGNQTLLFGTSGKAR